jgi:hypothetical protein
LAVAEEDWHGYAIIQDVAARTDGELKLSAGTLYRSIQRTLEQGLMVETQDRPPPRWRGRRRAGSHNVWMACDRGLWRGGHDALLRSARNTGMRCAQSGLSAGAMPPGRIAGAAVRIATVCEVLTNAAAVHRDILLQDLRYAARTLASSPAAAVSRSGPPASYQSGT